MASYQREWRFRGGQMQQCPLSRALLEAIETTASAVLRPRSPLLKALLLFGSFFLGLLLCFRHVRSPYRVSPGSEYIQALQNYKQVSKEQHNCDGTHMSACFGVVEARRCAAVRRLHASTHRDTIGSMQGHSDRAQGTAIATLRDLKRAQRCVGQRNRCNRDDGIGRDLMCSRQLIGAGQRSLPGCGSERARTGW